MVIRYLASGRKKELFTPGLAQGRGRFTIINMHAHTMLARVNVTCSTHDPLLSCATVARATLLLGSWEPLTMATGSNSNVSVTGNVNVQALSNAISVAITSQQATPVSSPSVVATSGSTSVQPGVTQPSSGNAASNDQPQSQR